MKSSSLDLSPCSFSTELTTGPFSYLHLKSPVYIGQTEQRLFYKREELFGCHRGVLRGSWFP